MTTDAKHIQPALSAEEWHARGFQRSGGSEVVGWKVDVDQFDGWISVACEYPTHHGVRNATNIHREWWPELLAFTNAALPADSPYKITRKDVEALRYVRAYEEDPTPPYVGERIVSVDRAATRRLRALAAKLAALLPPEG